MSVTIVATVGGPLSNSYLTLAEADTYHESRLFTDTWDDADVDTKNRALAMATRLIDAHFGWTGSAEQLWKDKVLSAHFAWTGLPASTTQKLCWPRTGMFTRNAVAIPSTVIPQELKDATAEFARQLITEDRSLDSDIEVQGLKSLSAGPVSLSFKDVVEGKVLPDAVWNLLVASWFSPVTAQPSIFGVL